MIVMLIVRRALHWHHLGPIFISPINSAAYRRGSYRQTQDDLSKEQMLQNLLDEDPYGFEAEQELEALTDTMEGQFNERENIPRESVEKLQRHIKKKIIERKYFKKPKEINLLTWDAKEQIRFLNAEYPNEWTVDRLAESFPCSRDGIIKVLKSKFKPRTLTQLLDHDKRVQYNWKGLKSGGGKEGGPITLRYEQLIESGKLHLVANATGIINLPKPVGKQQLYLQEPKKNPGPFESILTDYQASKGAKDGMHLEKLKSDQDMLEEHKQENMKLLERLQFGVDTQTTKQESSKEDKSRHKGVWGSTEAAAISAGHRMPQRDRTPTEQSSMDINHKGTYRATKHGEIATANVWNDTSSRDVKEGSFRVSLRRSQRESNMMTKEQMPIDISFPKPYKARGMYGREVAYGSDEYEEAGAHSNQQRSRSLLDTDQSVWDNAPMLEARTSAQDNRKTEVRDSQLSPQTRQDRGMSGTGKLPPDWEQGLRNTRQVYEGTQTPDTKYQEGSEAWLKRQLDLNRKQGEQPYAYSYSAGYMHPYGRPEDLPEEVDKEKLPGNAKMYKKGVDYYDEAGEFIFRVPHENTDS